VGHVEYKVEQLKWPEEGTHLDELVKNLNEWAKDGWRLASVDLTPGPSFEMRTLPVLLEREVDLAGDVQQRAYERYEERGRGEGQAVQDWQKAEHEVQAR